MLHCNLSKSRCMKGVVVIVYGRLAFMESDMSEADTCLTEVFSAMASSSCYLPLRRL